MNERITELYKEATGKDWAYDFDPQVAEKFAELIVRECAGIDFRHKVGVTTDQEFDTSRVILEHFGVDQ